MYTLFVPQPLRIAYLLEDTDLSGGVRVLVAQADALIGRGHSVTIATKGLPITWLSSRAEWIYVSDFSELAGSDFDFVVGTFWTTVGPAWSLAGNRALHLSQGYEGSFSFYHDQRAAIDAVYALPIPKLVVSRSLIPLLAPFDREVVWVGQIVDDSFYRSVPDSEHEPLRVLLPGASQIDLKGVQDGYGAALHARWSGAEFRLVRVSPWRPSSDEPVDEHVHEFHVALPAEKMTSLVHSCDVLIAPNHREEGFGLPAAEAMAAGLAVVMTRIPSFLSFDDRHDYAAFADEGDAEQLGESLLAVLGSRELRKALRRRAREVAEQFRSDYVADRLEAYLLRRRELLGKQKTEDR